MNGDLVVSIHDVAPVHRDRIERMLAALDAAGVRRRSLLVIPNYHGEGEIDRRPDFCEWLRQRQNAGDELLLHGYEHQDVRLPTSIVDRWKHRWFTQGEGEFLSLTYDEASDRIARGLAVFDRAGLRADGFVAPAWLINADGLRAARDRGLTFTNSYLRISDLANDHSWFGPSLVFGPGTLNEDVGIRLQAGVAGLLARRSIVRFVLHPPCVDHPARFARILAMLRPLVERHRPTTYGELVARLRRAPAAEARHRHAS
jgi:predicted deacetylase